MKNRIIVAVLACATFVSPVNLVWADGYEFFTAPRGKFVNLVYVGQIWDKSSGRVVREPVEFIVSDKGSGMTFPFVTERAGRYRSPDIGEAVRELAGAPLDPANLEFELSIPGYKNATFTNAPRKNMGVVELNFTVERDGATPVAGVRTGTAIQTGSEAQASTAAQTGIAAQAGTAEGAIGALAAATPGHSVASSRSRLIFIGIAGFAIIAGAAVRTSGRRRSTVR